MQKLMQNQFICWVILLLCLSYCIPLSEITSDIQLYNAAMEIYLQGDNPYSLQRWNTYWHRPGVPMVWNPPLFFPIYSLIYILISYNFIQIKFLSCLAAAVAIRSSWKIISDKDMPGYYILFFVLLSAPAVINLHINQISLLLMCGYSLILLYYFQKKDFLAGLFLPILLIKPHAFFFSLTILISASLIQKRYYLVIAGFISSICLLALAELYNAGITHAWINRDTWPIAWLGANFASLIRSLHLLIFSKDILWISFVVPVLFVAGGLYFLITRGAEWAYRNFAFIILLDPFAAPYGFITDFIGVMIPYIMLLAYYADKGLRVRALEILLAFSSIFLFTVLAENYKITLGIDSPLYWYTTPAMSLLLWIVVARGFTGLICLSRF